MTIIVGDQIAVVFQNFHDLCDAFGHVFHDGSACADELPAGDGREHGLDGGFSENLHCDRVAVFVEGVPEARFVVRKIALSGGS